MPQSVQKREIIDIDIVVKYSLNSLNPSYFPDCGPVANLSNGYVQYSPDTLYGATIYYYCNDGYEVTGLETRVCLYTGEWSDSQPACTILGEVLVIHVHTLPVVSNSGKAMADLHRTRCL